MIRLIISFLLLVMMVSCKAQDCNNLPGSFASYKQAISLIKENKFKFTESANTSNSSWITGAKYYSCDGMTGYFIYSTNKGAEYVHVGVPKAIWEGFKNASSKGSYYNAKLKDRYQLNVSR